jgi:hypothetical protein
MPAVILTLAEHYFNLAELAFKGYGADPEMLYNLGIQASWDYLSRDVDADLIADIETNIGTIEDYMAQPLNNVSYAVSTNKLDAIMHQKWIATNGITAEQSWFDYSRTGYPSNLPISWLASSTDRPVRLAYPNSEVTGNTLNIPTQPDPFTQKIFWAN